MCSKFEIVEKYRNVNIFGWEDSKMLDVIRSIVDVDVPHYDIPNEVHPTDNFGLAEWAMYHLLCDVCTSKTCDGSSLEEIFKHYHDMGKDELEGLGW